MAKEKIIIVAGEASGDIHAANLVRAIRSLSRDIRFFGLGGIKMKEAGVEVFYDLPDLAVVGFVEVIKNFKKFRRVFLDLLKKIDEIKPQAVILVDYPGFNLRLAKELKKRNLQVIYYISPQIWAWGANRIERIKRYVDKMIVIFKFEEELYYNAGLDVSFVGHPLLDIVFPTQSKKDFLKSNNLSDDNLIICLLPGSREKEIQRLFPIMLQTAKIIHKQICHIQFLVIKSPTLSQEPLTKYIQDYNLPIKIIENNTYNCLNACDFAIVASGTATLETAVMQVPMVIIYKVSFLTWLFLRPVLKIPYIGLVNVVAGRKIIPEFVQFKARPKIIAKEILNIVLSSEALDSFKQNLSLIKERLAPSKASQRAAEVIMNTISNQDF